VFNGPADLIGPALQGHPVELVDRQRDKELDARLKLPAHPAKGLSALIFGARDGGWVRDGRMRRPSPLRILRNYCCSKTAG
jgi:hypothetical protein